MEQRQATEQWIVSWDETMEAISQKIDSRFEELMELLRSMNGNSAASTSAGGGVVGGGAPVRGESWEAPRSADSQENGESRSSGPGSWNRLDSRIEVNRTPKIENPVDESSPKMTNLDERSVSGDRNHQEPRQGFLKEAQTPEEAEFRLQQLIASSKETERRMQRLYERNQQSMIAYQRQLEEYWKQDELEERERSINQSFEEPIHQSTDQGFEVSADSVLGKLEPELVDEDGGEPELVQEEQITNLSQEINPNMHLIHDPKDLQHHCESSKVIPRPLQDVVAEVASKEMGKLVDLLIELIEIRLANGRTSSMTDIGVCPMEFLETYDAQKLFVEIPREGSFFQIDVTSEAPWSGNRGDRCIAEELKALDHQFLEKFLADRGVIEYLKGLPVKFVFSEVNSDLLMIVIVEDSNEMARFNGVLDEQIEIGDAYQVFVEMPLRGIRRKWSSIQSGNTQSFPFPIIFDPGGSSHVLDCEKKEGPGISIGVSDLGVNLLRLKSSQDCRILVPFDRGKASRDVLHKQLDFGRPTCGIMVVVILVFDPGIGVFEC